MSLDFGLLGIRSSGDMVELVPGPVSEPVSVVASGLGVSAASSAGVLVVPGDSVLLGLDLVGRAGSGVDVPRLVSRVGLVGSGSSMGVSVGWSVEAVSWFVGLSD